MQVTTTEHVIIVVSPNLPSRHTLIHTPHEASIVHLAFAPIASKGMLLSADVTGCVCVWSKAKASGYSLNRWDLLYTLCTEPLVALAWLPSVEYSFHPQTPAASSTSSSSSTSINGGSAVPVEQRFIIPGSSSLLASSMLAFMSVSVSGTVELFVKRHFEGRWHVASARLPLCLPEQDSVRLAVVHFPTTRAGAKSALVAVTTREAPDCVYMYTVRYSMPSLFGASGMTGGSTPQASIVSLQTSFDSRVALSLANVQQIAGVPLTVSELRVVSFAFDRPATLMIVVLECVMNSSDRPTAPVYVAELWQREAHAKPLVLSPAFGQLAASLVRLSVALDSLSLSPSLSLSLSCAHGALIIRAPRATGSGRAACCFRVSLRHRASPACNSTGRVPECSFGIKTAL